LALIAGAILLLPGVCFVASGAQGGGSAAAGAIGLVILLFAAALFWLGFRLEPPKDRE